MTGCESCREDDEEDDEEYEDEEEEEEGDEGESGTKSAAGDEDAGEEEASLGGDDLDDDEDYTDLSKGTFFCENVKANGLPVGPGVPTEVRLFCVIPASTKLCTNDCRLAHRRVVLHNTMLIWCSVLHACCKMKRLRWIALLCRRSSLQDLIASLALSAPAQSCPRT